MKEIKEKEKEKKFVGVWLPPEIEDMLRSHCGSHGQKLSWVMGEAIKQYVAKVRETEAAHA